MLISTSPPATRKSLTLMPKNFSTWAPLTATTAQMMALNSATRSPVWRCSAGLKPSVSDKNSGKATKGFMIANMPPRALMKSALSKSVSPPLPLSRPR